MESPLPRKESKATEVLPLHPLQFRVLLVLMEGKLHGYAIAKEIEKRDESLGKIFPTNLYRRLRDMQDAGLIKEETRQLGSDGRRRFAITRFGRNVARAEALRLKALLADAKRHQLLTES